MEGSLTGKAILLVDDNAANRRVAEFQLTRSGCKVTAVEGARQALAALESSGRYGTGFDAVLADLGMPDIDGLALMKLIREIPEFRTIPVLILGSNLDRERVRSSEANGILVKPVRESHLLRAMLRIFEPESGPVGAALLSPSPLQGRGTILLAEDNLVNQRVAALTLQKLGYEVQVVADGRAAVEALERGVYDLVLMDCQMPEMDGFEATKAIRARAQGRSHIGIIALTANAFPGEREKCIAAGMDDYLAKPLNREALLRVLAKWAGKKLVFGDAA